MEGAGELDGEYDVDRFPTTRELIAYRKEVGLTPHELQEVLEDGGIEQLPLFVWVVWHRRGKTDTARRVFDVPYNVWDNIKKAPKEGEVELPPTEPSASAESSDAPAEPSGGTLSPTSAL